MATEAPDECRTRLTSKLWPLLEPFPPLPPPLLPFMPLLPPLLPLQLPLLLAAELWRERLTESGVLSGETKAESLLLMLLDSHVTMDVGVSMDICKGGRENIVSFRFVQ